MELDAKTQEIVEKVNLMADKLLVRVIDKEKTDGGIVLPESARGKEIGFDICCAQVLKKGPGNLFESGKRVPLDMKVGQYVLYPVHAGLKISVLGEEFIMIPAGHVFIYYTPDKENTPHIDSDKPKVDYEDVEGQKIGFDCGKLGFETKMDERELN